jgi:hypothetical protein
MSASIRAHNPPSARRGSDEIEIDRKDNSNRLITTVVLCWGKSTSLHYEGKEVSEDSSAKQRPTSKKITHHLKRQAK